MICVSPNENSYSACPKPYLRSEMSICFRSNLIKWRFILMLFHHFISLFYVFLHYLKSDTWSPRLELTNAWKGPTSIHRFWTTSRCKTPESCILNMAKIVIRRDVWFTIVMANILNLGRYQSVSPFFWIFSISYSSVKLDISYTETDREIVQNHWVSWQAM